MAGKKVLYRLFRGLERAFRFINNGGGQIFRRMFNEKLFRNEHSVSFEGWAAMWGFEYLRVDAPAFPEALPDRVVIEVRPTEAASERMWERCERL